MTKNDAGSPPQPKAEVDATQPEGASAGPESARNANPSTLSIRIQLAIVAALALGAYVIDVKLVAVLALLLALSPLATGYSGTLGAIVESRLPNSLGGGRLKETKISDDPDGYKRTDIALSACLFAGILILFAAAKYYRLGWALIQIGALIALFGAIAQVYLGRVFSNLADKKKARQAAETAEQDPPREESEVPNSPKSWDNPTQGLDG